jgi:hypothetical protein
MALSWASEEKRARIVQVRTPFAPGTGPMTTVPGGAARSSSAVAWGTVRDEFVVMSEAVSDTVHMRCGRPHWRE